MRIEVLPRFYLRAKSHFQKAPPGTKVMFEDGILWERTGELWQELTEHGILPMKRFLPSELMWERGRARVLQYPKAP